MFKTLIDPTTVASHIADKNWVVVDCRFDLTDPPKGEQLYLAAHIPGARYAHLDRDLSGEKSGANGRHPLPTPEQMRERFGAMGIDASKQVVVYDADNGIYAARLWWMLRFMGHDGVAVLDGGLARWIREGRDVRGGREHWSPAIFTGTPHDEWRVDAAAVLEGLRDPARVMVDARSETRFRGENETIDKAAGHIPGAKTFFFQRNLTGDNTFKRAEDLQTEWRALLGETRPDEVVMYCGSGVTACHNLLAMEHAGLGGARLYPGSWSEWSSDASRPRATGD